MNQAKEKTTFPLLWEELIRNPHQERPKEGSKEKEYWERCKIIYIKFLDEIRSEKLNNYRNFVSTIEKLHEILSPSQTGEPKLRAKVCANSYPQESIYAYHASKSLLDPHFSMRQKTSFPVLLDIPKEHLPSNLDTQHIYPYPNSFQFYLRKIHEQYLQIIDSKRETISQVLSISLFYQYSINARPFYKNNNSYFMLLVNALLHHIGLKGISHYLLDHLAHRLHYRNFSTVFTATVINKNPHLSVFNSISTYDSHSLSKDFLKYSLRLLSIQKSEIKNGIINTGNLLKEKYTHSKEIYNLIELYQNSLKKSLSKPKEPFIFSPQFIEIIPSNQIVIFCSEWYDTLYPLRDHFISTFPKKIPRAEDLKECN